LSAFGAHRGYLLRLLLLLAPSLSSCSFSTEEVVSSSGGTLSEVMALGPKTSCVRVSPLGNLLASIDDKRIVLRSIPDGTKDLRIPLGYGYGVIEFSPDGRTLAASGALRRYGGYLRSVVELWDVATAQLRSSLYDGTRDRFALAFRRDGRQILAAGEREVVLFDLDSGISRVSNNSEHDPLRFRSLAFAPHNGWFLGKPDSYSCFCPTVVRWIELNFTIPLVAVALTPDGTRAIGVGDDDYYEVGTPGISIVDAVTGNSLGEMRYRGKYGPALLSVAVSTDGRYFATGDEEGRLSVWRVANGQLVADLMSECGPVEEISFGPAGLLAARGVRNAKLWRLRDEQ
jgi:WD40 repeat protein